MFGKFKGWFSALSTAGRVGFIVTVVAVGLIANAASHPQTKSTTAVEGTSTEAPKVVTEHKTVSTTEEIKFDTKTVDDPTLASGTDQTKTDGINGIRTKTWDVTYINGKETGRVSVNDGITTEPVTKVIAHGTYIAPPKPKCDPNYSGCVPIASDVDCAGGSGNGPAYVSGPIQVIGSDIYGLDRDGDGIACE